MSLSSKMLDQISKVLKSEASILGMKIIKPYLGQYSIFLCASHVVGRGSRKPPSNF